MHNVISIDLGASNGRVFLATLDNLNLTIQEMHRFPNAPIEKKNELFWDIDYIIDGIKRGIKTAHEMANGPIEGLGIDTWGVDVGFVCQNDELIEDPYSYRGSHSNEIMDQVHAKIPKKQLFLKTGVETAPINTLYQLAAIFSKRPALEKQTDTILTLPSLIVFLLTGKKYNEFTHASTTQLLNVESQDWDLDIMKAIYRQIPPFAKNKRTNTIVGDTKDVINRTLGIDPISVINVPGHDTACAHVAMPLPNEQTVFMSCGTWVLIGVEVKKPVITEEAYNWGFTNEGTPQGTYRLQKNNMGLWLLQQCKKEWEQKGEPVTYSEETDLISETQPFEAFIDPDDEAFFNPSSMTGAIKQFCEKTNQAIPQTKGAFIRCILESLALKYRWIVERLEVLTSEHLSTIHMAGGGIQNEQLCQFTANATNRNVTTGPIEASAIGNALSQFMALGICSNLEEARDISRRVFSAGDYMPVKTDKWDQAYQRFLKIVT